MTAEFMFITFTLFLAGMIAVPLASRFGLGSVLGYLIAGIAIGPVLQGLVWMLPPCSISPNSAL